MSSRFNVMSTRENRALLQERFPRQFAPRLRSTAGFTLVELMVVVSLLAILMGLAAPSFARLAKAAAISSAVNQFLADMRFARSEAVRRGGGVVLCRSEDPESAEPTCSSSLDSAGWASGWIVFNDINGNGERNPDEGLIRIQARQTGVESIATGGTPTVFRFGATGRLLAPGPIASLQFGGSNVEADIRRVVCVNAGGRARLAGNGSATCGAEG